METIVRRYAEGNVLQLMYRRPPSPEPDSDIPSRPEPPKKPKGSVALQLPKAEVAVTDPYMDDEGLLEFPKEELVEEVADTDPDMADEGDTQEEMDQERERLLQEKWSSGTSRSNVWHC